MSGPGELREDAAREAREFMDPSLEAPSMIGARKAWDPQEAPKWDAGEGGKTARSRWERGRREKRIAAGLCSRCGKAGAAPGRKLCCACLAKDREAAARQRARLTPEELEKRREYLREWGRKTHALRRKAGICLACGKEDAAPGRVHCPACLERIRESANKKRTRVRAVLAEAERLGGAGTLAKIMEERMRLPDWRKDHPGIRGRLAELLFDAFYMEQSLARLYDEAGSLGAAPCKGWREFVQGEILKSQKAALIEWAKSQAGDGGHKNHAD